MFIKNIFLTISQRLLYFGDNSNLHGLRYVTETRRNLYCRIFWLAALVACAVGLRSMLSGAIRSAQEEALSFTPDVDRLKWQTAFPAVTICEKYMYHDTLRTLKKIHPEFMDQFNFNYKKMFTDMCFGENTCELCSRGCEPPVNCSIDYRSLADEIRKTCIGLIHDCKWNDETVDCCTYFLPIDTETGTCYSLNTRQSRLSGTVPLFRSNISTGPGHLSFSIYKPLVVYLHGADDIPWVKMETDGIFEATTTNLDFYFRMVEMTNDPLVRELDMDVRKCRFPDEVIPSAFGQSYQIYGYSTCIVTCETELMFEKCQCIHHLRDTIYKDKHCNYTGLGCLADFAEERKRLSPQEGVDLCKHCLPSCEEIEISRVYRFEAPELDGDDEDEEEDVNVNIRMISLPTIQYKRNVVRTKLDLVVSIGGLAGLFFGASLLSLVEAFYFIFIRVGANLK